MTNHVPTRGSFVVAANWKEEILQYISPDQLPQAYGGTRCEPDPICSDFVSCGGRFGGLEGGRGGGHTYYTFPSPSSSLHRSPLVVMYQQSII